MPETDYNISKEFEAQKDRETVQQSLHKRGPENESTDREDSRKSSSLIQMILEKLSF